ncbi:MFS transporter [Demequina zhanjiangensis]|uniref:MFS transporter n=1 Tax=Demequina zhanjiangensis TaxID=3051659 RepID=A0ABT8G0P2_9MICO|nr:MFS transporter [Demequina sp. SYSU T00b26]MDN4472653.1 MFS transporter [Demequina sp. SYSU T00b26]
MSDSEVPAARVRRARVSLVVLFSGVGILAGSLVSRTPSIRDDLQVSPAEFGTVLLTGALGGIVAFAFTGGLVARFGALRVVRSCTVGSITGLLTMALATALSQPILYAAGLFAALGIFEIFMAILSAEAATLERVVDRPILSQFHAAFSLSMLAGLGLGAGYSFAGVPVAWHFTLNGIVVGTAFLAVSRGAFLDGMPDASAQGGEPRDFFGGIKNAVRERRTLALGLILLCAFTTEAAAGNWIPLAIVDDYSRTEAVAGLTYAGVILAQSITRVIGVPGLARLGRVTTLRVSALLIALGALGFAFSPAWWLVIVALLVWGVGTAFSFPVALSAAADERTDATSRVAAVNVFATAGGLITPLLIGLLAEAMQIRQALLLVVVAALVIFVLSPVARVPAQLAASAPKASPGQS